MEPDGGLRGFIRLTWGLRVGLVIKSEDLVCVLQLGVRAALGTSS